MKMKLCFSLGAHETKYICMPISVNLQCCNIEQLFGLAMKKKHWVLKEALGAQGSTGCSRKHCVLHWEKRKALRIKWSSTCFFSIAVLASWCLLAFHPFGDVGSHSGSFILYAQV